MSPWQGACVGFGTAGVSVSNRGGFGVTAAILFVLVGSLVFAELSKTSALAGREFLRGAVYIGSGFAVAWTVLATLSLFWADIFRP
jgi:hypothetical protein